MSNIQRIISPDERKAKMLAREDVTDLYERGVKLFTRADLEHIGAYVEACTRGLMAPIELRCLDGRKYLSTETMMGSGTPQVDFRIYQDHLYDINESLRMIRLGPGPYRPGYPAIYLGTIQKMWDEMVAAWNVSPLRVRLLEVLGKSTLPQITKLICFGLGTLEWDFAHPRPGPRQCTIQHLAALTIRAFLSGKMRSKVELVAQDPYYSEATQIILKKEDFKVTTSPVQGFLELDESSVVFTVDCDAPVKQIVADLTRPAMMMWARVSRPYEETAKKYTKKYERVDFPNHWYKYETVWVQPWDPDNDSPRTQALVRHDYTEHRFSGFKNGEVFGDNFCLYVRKENTKELAKPQVAQAKEQWKFAKVPVRSASMPKLVNRGSDDKRQTGEQHPRQILPVHGLLWPSEGWPPSHSVEEVLPGPKPDLKGKGKAVAYEQGSEESMAFI
ncbi:hypothetical protein F5Y15DRAFT_381092 [Xylariaceae sp. FL0016]|nr:hypothetical protein F5Y15DRAFT_381092 [Xylariaceae sp. FL0016]